MPNSLLDAFSVEPNDFRLAENLVILNSKSIRNILIISLVVLDIPPDTKKRINDGKLLAISIIFKGDLRKFNLLGQHINRTKNSIKNQQIIMISSMLKAFAN